VLSDSPNTGEPLSEPWQNRARGAAGTKKDALMTQSVVLCLVLWDCPGKTRYFKQVKRFQSSVLCESPAREDTSCAHSL